MIFGRSFLRGSLRQGSPRPLGSGEAVDALAVKDRLKALGDDGEVASRLDRAVEEMMSTLGGLSALTVPLALSYLDRIARPLEAMDLESGVRLTTWGYAAHLVIEERGRDFGVETVPVMGELPALRRGAVPQGLLTHIVKVTRRSFEVVRAVSAPTWDGFVITTAGRLHRARRKGEDGNLPPAVDLSVIDALLRFGWVLRQVDLHYHFEPDRR